MKKISERSAEIMVVRHKADRCDVPDHADKSWYDYLVHRASQPGSGYASYPSAQFASIRDILAALDEYQADVESRLESRNAFVRQRVDG